MKLSRGIIPIILSAVLAMGFSQGLAFAGTESDSLMAASLADALVEDCYGGTEPLGNFDGTYYAASHTDAVQIVDSGLCGNNLTWSLTSDGILTISGVGDMYDYGYDFGSNSDLGDAPWTPGLTNHQVYEVVISPGVTGVGNAAFYLCDELVKVSLPNGLERIGRSAFQQTALTNIVVPGSVRTVGAWAFNGCERLETAVISDGVLTIAEGAFSGCKKLRSARIPESVISMGGWWSSVSCEYGNSLLKTAGPLGSGCNIEFGWSNAIPADAFHYLGDLREVTLPASLQSIGSAAFADCDSLKRINIPSSVVNVGEGAFAGSGLESAGPLGSDCEMQFGWVETIPKNAIISSSVKELVLPEGMTEVEDGFLCSYWDEKYGYAGSTWATIWSNGGSYYNPIESITLPSTLKSIGAYAFYDCGMLASVSIPNGVEFVGTEAFGQCGLTSVVIPSSVAVLGGYADNEERAGWYRGYGDVFDGCNGLQTAGPIGSGSNIQYGWGDAIPDGAFSGTDGLASVSFPEGLSSIGDRAFSNCDSLTTVAIPDGVEVGGNAFAYCDGLRKVVIPASVTQFKIGSYEVGPFEDCPLLKTAGPIGGDFNIEFGWKEAIPADAFANVSSLRSIVFPEGLEQIGFGAFSGCSRLVAEIPEGVTSIWEYAFSSCSNLIEITLPDGLVNIGAGAFAYCENLQRVVIPASVTCESAGWRGTGIFEGCSKLKSAGPQGSNCDILLGWTDFIPEYFFVNCDCLESVEVPDGVYSIKEGAFDYCANLSTVVIPKSVTSVGYDNDGINQRYTGVFSNCRKLKTAGGVGSGCNIQFAWENIPDCAFCGCEDLTSVYIPDGVKGIGEYAFRYCGSLSYIYLPESLKSFDYSWGAGSLSGCAGLQTAGPVGSGCNVEYSWTDCIPNGAFYKCESLANVYFPSTVKKIGKYAFSQCANLSDAYYDDTEAKWNQVVIGDCNDSLLGATMHFANYKTEAGVIRQGEGWAMRWQCVYSESALGVKSNASLRIYMDGSDSGDSWKFSVSDTSNDTSPWLTATGIPKEQFTKVAVAGSSTNPIYIATNQFAGYTGLKSIQLSHVYGFGDGAFQGCSSLKTVNGFDGDLHSIGRAAFKNCTSLFDIAWTGKATALTNIGDEAFANTALTSLVLNRSVESIGTGAFSGTGLTIMCYQDSCAHKYAVSNRIPYSILYDGSYARSLDMCLQTSPVYYDNDLALIAAKLSLATYQGNGDSGVRSYLRDLGFVDENMYSNNYGGSLAFTVATKSYTGSGGNSDADVLVIAAQGSTNPYEYFMDSASFRTDPVNGYSSYVIVRDFYNAIFEGLDHVVQPNKRYKVLVTGHSLGGAAANLVAAALTERYGQRDVFCYTFGAINSVVTNSTIASGYGNIHNIYNDLDTFSPYQCGWIMVNGAGSKYGKFGHMDSFACDYREPWEYVIGQAATCLRHVNHDMSNYLEAVQSGRVKNSSLRSCSVLPDRLKGYSVVACPVDVDVYCDDSLVGRVVDNWVDSSVTTIPIFVEGETKFILYPDEGDYRLDITAYDEGSLVYSYQDLGETEECKSFNNVELTEGKRLRSEVTEDMEVQEAQLYVVSESTGDSIAEVQQDGTEVGVQQGSGTWGTCLWEISAGILTVHPGEGIALDAYAGASYWIDYADEITAVVFAAEGGARVVAPADSSFLLCGLKNMKTIDLSGFDASNVTDATCLFVGCSSLAALDLSGFNASNVASMAYMFEFCSSLKTVLVGDGWSTASVMASDGMFEGCTSLVGGNGTVYSASHTDAEYAHVDSEGTPGYFTAKGASTKKGIASAEIELSQASYVYDGKAKEPAVTMTLGSTKLARDTDFTVEYADNVDAGQASVTITGAGAYDGSKSAEFTITPAPIGGAVVSGVEDREYTGEPITQSLTVRLGERTLAEGWDYVLSYEDNVEVGTAAVVATGMGNYEGAARAEFEIKAAKQSVGGGESGNSTSPDPDESGGSSASSGSEGEGGGSGGESAGEGGDGSGGSADPKDGDGSGGAAVSGSGASANPSDEGPGGSAGPSGASPEPDGPAEADPASFAGAARAGGFTDLDAGAWYMSEGFKDDYGRVVATYLDYTIGRGLMSGYAGTTRFAPDDTLTRGMAATIVYRMATGATAATTNNSVQTRFSDVHPGDWYAAAVKWCAEEGVVTGYSGTGLFGPGDPVTREQLAAMVARYCTKVAGMPSAGADVSRFPDGGAITSWAREAAAFCAVNGIITGKGDTGAFDPAGLATRCQMAKVIAVTASLEG